MSLLGFGGVTTIGQALELLDEFAPRVRAVQYLTAAGTSIYVYDYLLTFPAELRLIWRSKQISLAKLAYVINRYGTIILLALLLVRKSPPQRYLHICIS